MCVSTGGKGGRWLREASSYVRMIVAKMAITSSGE